MDQADFLLPITQGLIGLVSIKGSDDSSGNHELNIYNHENNQLTRQSDFRSRRFKGQPYKTLDLGTRGIIFTTSAGDTRHALKNGEVFQNRRYGIPVHACKTPEGVFYLSPNQNEYGRNQFIGALMDINSQYLLPEFTNFQPINISGDTQLIETPTHSNIIGMTYENNRAVALLANATKLAVDIS